MTHLFRHLPPRRERPRVLFDDQRAAAAKVIEKIRQRPILVLPTGGGKTVVASAIVQYLNVPTLWLAHRSELIDQAAASLRYNGLRVGVIMAGRTWDDTAPVQVASVQSLANREAPRPGLIVIDECHRATEESYRAILNRYTTANVMGLTATPFRLDGRGLGDVFGEIIVGGYADDLVNAGRLHAPRVYAAAPPDLRGVAVKDGEYNLAQAAQRLAPASEIVQTWQRHRTRLMRTVAFAVDLDHSRNLVAAFNCAGITAEHLDGKTHEYDRAAILARLKSGETEIVSNCLVLTEGWDLPTLECAIIQRPTASLNLHLQMIGRIMRVAKGKQGAIILDHAGNHHVHGLVTRRLNYSLDGSVKAGTAEPLGLRQCRQCFVLYSSAVNTCPECGFVAPPMERKSQEADSAGELGEFVEDFEYRKSIWHIIQSECQANDYRPAWAIFRYAKRFGAPPLVADGELIDPAHATREQKAAVYAGLMDVVKSKGLKPGWASHRYQQMFGVWPKGFVADVKGRAEIVSKWSQMVGGRA